MTKPAFYAIIANVAGSETPADHMKCAAVAHLVERHLAKVEVASSSLVGRSRQNKPLQNMIRRVMQRLFCTLKAFLELEKEGKTQ